VFVALLLCGMEEIHVEEKETESYEKIFTPVTSWPG